MDHPAGSWLAVGRIRRPHGIHGDVVADIETDFPERLQAGMEVGIGAGAPERLIGVHQVRLHKGAWLLSFVGLRTLEEIEPLRGAWLYLPEQPREELPEHYYYEHELLGCQCLDTSGKRLGEVAALSPGGGGMLLEVRTAAGDEVLVPFVSPIVVSVDPALRSIVLDPPIGLFAGHAL
jgi:16S rRNA processing protein RimM